jgi:anaerobic selenocysteine-containing dehydrogenase
MESGFPSEWCSYTRGKIIKEVCHHPDRLRYPLKRLGPRGSGQWKRISWNEAIQTIARNLKSYKEKYGPESVALCLGEPKGMEFAFAQRFASEFGTPNVVTPGNY